MSQLLREVEEDWYQMSRQQKTSWLSMQRRMMLHTPKQNSALPFLWWVQNWLLYIVLKSLGDDIQFYENT